jgi:hypothetical protein
MIPQAVLLIAALLCSGAGHAESIPADSFEAKLGPAQNEVNTGLRDNSEVAFWGLQRSGTKVVYSTLIRSGGRCNLPKGTKFIGEFDEATNTVKGSTELRTDCPVDFTLCFGEGGLSGGTWSLGGARLRSYSGGQVLPVKKPETNSAQPK